jgi:membrane-associated phospholipid phosphatase
MDAKGKVLADFRSGLRRRSVGDAPRHAVALQRLHEKMVVRSSRSMHTLPQTNPSAPAATDPVGSIRAGRWRPLFGRLVVAGVLAALGGLLFTVDLPVARWFREHDLPGDLGRLIDLSEVFAHGLGVAVLLGVAVGLDRGLRPIGAAWRDIVRLVVASYAGGIVVDAIKMLVTRVRPRSADLADLASPFATFGTGALQGPVEVSEAVIKSSALMSFPSGHAAVAAGLATTLAWKYPHGLPIFAALAACAAAQRVVSSAHYPSDVAFGAAVGVAAAAVCLGRSRPAGFVVAGRDVPC